MKMRTLKSTVALILLGIMWLGAAPGLHAQTQSSGVIISGDINVYTATPKITQNASTVQAYVDQTQVTASVASNTCSPTTSASTATGKGVARGGASPTCVWTWTSLPDIIDSNNGLQVKGRWSTSGPRAVGAQISVVDQDGTTYPLSTQSTTITVTGDVTAPTVTFLNNGTAFTGGSLTTLGGVTFTLADPADPSPLVTGLTVKTGAGSVTVPFSPSGSNAYTPSWPTLAPGYYQLVVSTSDVLGNTGTTTLGFAYSPPYVGWAAGNTVMIPAVTKALRTASGAWPATSATMRASGAPVSGAISWNVTSAANSTVSVVINGVTIAPGASQVPIGSISMDSSVLSVPIAAATAGSSGTAYLTFATSTPSVPELIGTVQVYTSTPTASVTGTTVQAYIGETVANMASGGSCKAVSTATAAQGLAVSANGAAPTCYYQWAGLPDIVDSNTGSQVKGRWKTVGPRTLTYTVSAVDSDGTTYQIGTGTTQITVNADTTPPAVTYQYNGNNFTGGTVAYLSELAATLSDPADPAPTISSASLLAQSSGATLPVTVVPGTGGTNTFTFPGNLAAGTYTLQLATADALGTTGTSTLRFYYSPPIVAWSKGKAISIPAVTTAMHTSAGGWPATSATMQMANAATATPVSGNIAWSVSSDPSSTVTVVVNGTAIAPGASQQSIGNVSVTNGTLALPVAAATAGQGGVAHLTISTTTANVPSVVGDVNVYAGTLTVNLAKNPIQALFDTLSATGSLSSGSGCKLTSTLSQATGASVAATPMCYLQWDTSEIPLNPTSSNTGALTGWVKTAGSYPLNYSLAVVDTDGTIYPMSSGSTTVTVAPSNTSFNLGLTGNLSQYYTVGNGTVTMGNLGGNFNCRITGNQIYAQQNAGNAITPICYGEFTSLPTGFTAVSSSGSAAPQATGTFTSTAATFGLQATWYAKDGSAVVVATNTVTVQANDPPAPTVSFTPNNPSVVPTSGGSIGTLSVSSALNTPLQIAVTDETGTNVFTGSASANGATSINYKNSVTVAGGLSAAAQKTYTISVGYAALPAEAVQKTANVTVIPATSVKPTLTSTASSATTTTPIPVSVAITDVNSGTYNSTAMGAWQVEIASVANGNIYTPLTSFANVAADGTAQFSVSSGTISTPNIQLVAIAQETATTAQVQRVSQILTMPLASGAALPVAVTASPTAGPAPLTTTLTATATGSSLQQQAMGKASWQISTDGGNTFQPLSGVSGNQVQTQVPAGGAQYQAVMTNVNSGLQSTSAPVTVSPFNVVQGTVSGPTSIAAGQAAAYSLTVTENGNALDPTQYSAQWSTDQGKTYTAGGATFNLDTSKITISGPQYVWAQIKDINAPNVPTAWTTVKTNVAVSYVPAPLVIAYIPKSIQAGAPVTLTAKVTSVNGTGTTSGAWTFPDGTTATGLSATWTPPNSLLTSTGATPITFVGTATTTAGATSSATVSVNVSFYQPVLKPVALLVTTAGTYSPTTATLTVQSTSGTIPADANIQWSVPNDAQQTITGTNSITVTEPDSGPISYGVTVTDSFGNVQTASKTINVPAPPPWTLSMSYSTSNQWNRAPLTVKISPLVGGGSPTDKLASLTYSVDGVTQTTTQSASVLGVVAVPVGQHSLTVDLLSQNGLTAHTQKTITAVAPIQPSCTISGATTSTGWTASASCKGVNTNIASYTWTVNGVAGQPTNSYYITALSNQYSSKPTFSVVATDDAGQTTTPVSW